MDSMEADQIQYYQHLVRHAIRALGFSREERGLKRQKIRRMDLIMEAMIYPLTPNVYEYVHSGSFADGLNFQTSDFDVIQRVPGFKVLSNFTLPRFGPQILSKENSSFYAICGIEYVEEFPCYVKLPILKICSQKASEFTYIKCLKTYYLRNTDNIKQLLDSTQLSDRNVSEIHKNKCTDRVEYKRNGPAVREEFFDFASQFKSKRDLVPTLFFDDWPSIATEFLNRHRIKKWPSKQILRRFTTRGCDLAPVGHTDSQDKDLLWRISFCSERDLIISLNEIQVYCFLLIKIILKDDLPLNDETNIISSFHLKNVIFWCIERSLEPWSRRNFFNALKRCLFRLMDFLANGHLPHFIIPTQNLFNSRLTNKIGDRIIQVLEKYANNPIYIIALSSFDKLFPQTVHQMDLSERVSNLKITQLKLQTQRSIVESCFTSLMRMFCCIKDHDYWKYFSSWHDVNLGLHNWKMMYKIVLSKCEPYMRYELKYMRCIGALMVYARYKQTNDDRDVRSSRSLIEESLDLKVSSATLRAASFYYMDNDYERCIEICETFVKHPPKCDSSFDYVVSTFNRYIEKENISILKQWKSGLIKFYGLKNGNVKRMPHGIPMLLEKFTSLEKKCITVVYVTAEKWAVPEVLLYELLSRSKDAGNTHYRQFAGIFVDPLFNAFLLLYLCSRNRKDDFNPYYIEVRDNALKSMKSCLDENSVQPRYQYCNVYSYCLLKSDLKVEAVRYILESLCNYPSKYNAAFGYLRAIVPSLQQIA